MSREQLVAVYRDTQQKIRAIQTPASEKFQGLLNGHVPSKNHDNPVTIQVVNTDTFEATHDLVDEGLNPLVLNMASEFKAGGGAHKGSRAQEEDLARCSDLLNTLDPNFYPMKVDEAIYSPKITVIKDSSYKNLRKQFTCAMISCAALRNPKVRDNYSKYRFDGDREIMSNKIKMVLQTADYYKHDSLVLGAWGCGAFHNPVEEVATLFKENIEPFKHTFKRIVFAVLDRRMENIPTFERVFKN